MVKVKCRRIGNALGFIIPSKYLFKVDIEEGDIVEVLIENNKIILIKVKTNEEKDNGVGI